MKIKKYGRHLGCRNLSLQSDFGQRGLRCATGSREDVHRRGRGVTSRRANDREKRYTSIALLSNDPANVRLLAGIPELIPLPGNQERGDGTGRSPPVPCAR